MQCACTPQLSTCALCGAAVIRAVVRALRMHITAPLFVMERMCSCSNALLDKKKRAVLLPAPMSLCMQCAWAPCRARATASRPKPGQRVVRRHACAGAALLIHKGVLCCCLSPCDGARMPRRACQQPSAPRSTWVTQVATQVRVHAVCVLAAAFRPGLAASAAAALLGLGEETAELGPAGGGRARPRQLTSSSRAEQRERPDDQRGAPPGQPSSSSRRWGDGRHNPRGEQVGQPTSSHAEAGQTAGGQKRGRVGQPTLNSGAELGEGACGHADALSAGLSHLSLDGRAKPREAAAAEHTADLLALLAAAASDCGSRGARRALEAAQAAAWDGEGGELHTLVFAKA